ncbi:ABC transporter ATP-binding protein [Candidatus Dependentiae bacterium]|nr:ABC transporter ATP-binding protein [Candidatus Dependentiae bacterium]
MSGLKLEHVTKYYGSELVIDNLSLEIPQGQFFALAGPSGCGKTTILRLIAGLETVNSGNIFLGKKNITSTPIHERKINTVFQSYALFPHLSVFENVAYPLRVRRTSEDEIEDKVLKILKTVCLSGHDQKMIGQLSGGQQQRVALARSIVAEPEVLLLDEPLAALDQRLKEQMLIELIDLQEKLGMTFVYITHDQREALTVADRMAILNVRGRVEQLSTPKNIYEFPASRFVANFVGTTNIIHGILHKDDGAHCYELETTDFGAIKVYVHHERNWIVPGAHSYISLRPEKIKITKKRLPHIENIITGTIKNILYQGQATLFDVEISENCVIKVFKQNEDHVPEEILNYDDEVNLHFYKEDVVLLEH